MSDSFPYIHNEKRLERTQPHTPVYTFGNFGDKISIQKKVKPRARISSLRGYADIYVRYYRLCRDKTIEQVSSVYINQSFDFAVRLRVVNDLCT